MSKVCMNNVPQAQGKVAPIVRMTSHHNPTVAIVSKRGVVVVAHKRRKVMN